MENPLSIHYRDKSDTELISAALEGSMASLEALLARHRNFIYNIALKMVADVNDAEDITQEGSSRLLPSYLSSSGKVIFVPGCTG